MLYFVNTNGNYITGISQRFGQTQITKEEYDEISSIISSCPSAPDGYAYLLKTDLTWELVELPSDENATAEDYEAALSELGVNV